MLSVIDIAFDPVNLNEVWSRRVGYGSIHTCLGTDRSG